MGAKEVGYSAIRSREDGYAALARAVLRAARQDGEEMDGEWEQLLWELGRGSVLLSYENNIDKYASLI